MYRYCPRASFPREDFQISTTDKRGLGRFVRFGTCFEFQNERCYVQGGVWTHTGRTGNTGPVCSFLFRFVPAPPGVFEPVGIPTIEPVPFRLALHARCAGFLDLDVLRSLGLFHASSRRGRSSARPSSFASRASSLGVPAAPPAANGRYASARACLLPSSRLTACEQARGGALGVGGRHEVLLRLGSSTS